MTGLKYAKDCEMMPGNLENQLADARSEIERLRLEAESTKVKLSKLEDLVNAIDNLAVKIDKIEKLVSKVDNQTTKRTVDLRGLY